jgi:hypothetical protein
MNNDQYFLGAYVGWRQTRIAKIEQIFSKEFFKDKTVLELASGYGYLGKYFREELGSIVTFAEGNEEFIKEIQNLNPEVDASEIICLDQNKLWNLNKKFDVIIHFGVMYHLDNWIQDLECAANHTDLIILESEVCDSDDPEFEIKIIDINSYDQALVIHDRKATIPSAAYVESELTKHGFKFTRYDDADLNHDQHHYNWIVKNENKNHVRGQRRFWICKREK